MTNLYRLVKADGFCFQAFGVKVGIRLNEPRMLRKIEERLPVGWGKRPPSAVDLVYSFFFNHAVNNHRVRRFHVLYGNSQILARSDNEDELLEDFERQIRTHVSVTSRSKCFVHAGVVGWRGKAIVMPGGSFSGKTTLVMEFLKQGASYYSDEFAVFDRRGYVYPFPKPLGVRNGDSDKQIELPATLLTTKIGVKPIPVGLILVTEYKKFTSWRPHGASAGKAVLKLLANSLSARANPSGNLACLGKAVDGAQILFGSRGDAHEIVQKVLNG